MGTKDIVGHDFEKLLSYLPDESTHFEYLNDYAHLDYLWSVEAYKDLYPQIISSIQDCCGSPS